MDIREKIRNGDYRTQLVMPRKASGATPEEIAKGRTAYYEDSSRLRAEFRKDAIEDAGLTGHKKADKAFDIAWGEHHDNGLENVVDFLGDLADLLL